MSKRQTILYLMHVDWDWIKQRPHFVAEGLSDYFDIKVIYRSTRGKSSLTTNPRDRFETVPLPHLRMQRFGSVSSLNELCSQRLVSNALAKYKPDLLWITHPDMYRLARKQARCKVIYDCMDDVLGFVEPGSEKWSQLQEMERLLIRDASHIFVSSANLSRIIDEREPCGTKLTLARNAYSGDILDTGTQPNKETNRFRICYFGTVSDWFDWDSLRYCLEKFANLEFQIIGPFVNTKPFTNDRLIITGPVDHAKLDSYVRDCDCFMMPFLVNDLLLSVDPVKLYEYINFNKPIISVYYDEIKRFDPYVSFYSDKKGMAEAVAKLMSSPQPKYNQEERVMFLRENGWKNRVDTIVRALTDIASD